MKAGLLAAAASIALLGVSSSAPAPFPFPDLKLGQPVSELIRAHGSPSVVTTDVGHVWTWDKAGLPKIRLTTDDDGTVRVIDIVPKGTVDFTLPSDEAQTRVPLALGELTLAAADKSSLATLAEANGNAAFPDTSAPALFRAYRISSDTALVLLFGETDKTLDEAFYGSRAALARSGLLPAGTVPPQARYTAPVVVHLGAYDYPASKHQGDAFVRIGVRKDGTVSNASIYVSSGSSDLDAIAVLAAKEDTFTPAKRGDEPVDSVFFHKEEFRTLQPAH